MPAARTRTGSGGSGGSEEQDPPYSGGSDEQDPPCGGGNMTVLGDGHTTV